MDANFFRIMLVQVFLFSLSVNLLFCNKTAGGNKHGIKKNEAKLHGGYCDDIGCCRFPNSHS